MSLLTFDKFRDNQNDHTGHQNMQHRNITEYLKIVQKTENVTEDLKKCAHSPLPPRLINLYAMDTATIPTKNTLIESGKALKRFPTKVRADQTVSKIL